MTRALPHNITKQLDYGPLEDEGCDYKNYDNLWMCVKNSTINNINGEHVPKRIIMLI
jgi:hypothetical protein